MTYTINHTISMSTISNILSLRVFVKPLFIDKYLKKQGVFEFLVIEESIII